MNIHKNIIQMQDTIFGFKLLKWRRREAISHQHPCTMTKALHIPVKIPCTLYFWRDSRAKGSIRNHSNSLRYTGESTNVCSFSYKVFFYWSLVCNSWKTRKRANHERGSVGLKACSQADRLHFPGTSTLVSEGCPDTTHSAVNQISWTPVQV